MICNLGFCIVVVPLMLYYIIVKQLQEKFIAKRKKLYITFVDMEKAFDRVPQKVVW